MQKNKATKGASPIILTSPVLRCIWCIALIRDDRKQLALPPSASRLHEEGKAEACHPFLLISLLESSLLMKMMTSVRKIGVFLILKD